MAPFCPLHRAESRTAAGLAEGSEGRGQESSLPGHPGASAHDAPTPGSQTPTCVSDSHHLPESEYKGCS